MNNLQYIVIEEAVSKLAVEARLSGIDIREELEAIEKKIAENLRR